MRFATFLIIAAVLFLNPSNADARKRHGGLFGFITAPLHMMIHRSAGPRSVRHRSARRAYAQQDRAEKSAGEPANQQNADRAGQQNTAPAPFNVYEEILGYALWPDDHASRFWAHGYGDILSSFMSPAAAMAAMRGREAAREGGGAQGVDTAAGAPATSACVQEADRQAERPLDRIGETSDLTEPQRAELATLRAAVTEAVERGKAACLDGIPRTPSDRLKAMMDGLWAMRDAVILFRTPLDRFYNSLTDDQKAKLTTKPNAGTVGGPEPASAACGHAVNDLPIDELKQSVGPKQDQQGGLAMLQGLSADLSKYLAQACPQDTPATPVGRLDAVGNRVNALVYAAVNIDAAIAGFYQQLNNDQKKKFDSMGR